MARFGAFGDLGDYGRGGRRGGGGGGGGGGAAYKAKMSALSAAGKLDTSGGGTLMLNADGSMSVIPTGKTASFNPNESTLSLVPSPSKTSYDVTATESSGSAGIISSSTPTKTMATQSSEINAPTSFTQLLATVASPGATATRYTPGATATEGSGGATATESSGGTVKITNTPSGTTAQMSTEASVPSVVMALLTGRGASAGQYIAAQRRMAEFVDDEDEDEDEDEDGEGEDDGAWGGILDNLPGVKLVRSLTLKGRRKNRKKKAQKLARKLKSAKASGNTQAIARIQKKVAKQKAKTIKRALRRKDNGKPLSKHEKRVLAHEKAKAKVRAYKRMAAGGRDRNIAAATATRMGVSSSDLEAQANALEQTAAMSDAAVANAMDTSDAALENTAAVSADLDEAEGGLFGLSWWAIAGITAGLGAVGYAVSKGVKKEGGKVKFQPAAIMPGIKSDFKKLTGKGAA